MKITDGLLLQRCRELSDMAKNPILMEVFQGPTQITPTQLKTRMEKEIDQRVEGQLTIREHEKQKSNKFQRSQSPSQKIFGVDPVEDEAAVKYR